MTRQRQLRQRLAEVLTLIKEHDTIYDRRYVLVFEALGLAAQLFYATGIRVDPAEPGYPVVYIELPTGQVSWHMPEHPVPWDEHTTEEKYRRCAEYVSRNDLLADARHVPLVFEENTKVIS